MADAARVIQAVKLKLVQLPEGLLLGKACLIHLLLGVQYVKQRT